MTPGFNRRQFIAASATATAAAAVSSNQLLGFEAVQSTDKKPLFNISLAQWSLHRALKSKKLDNLDFPKLTKEEFGICLLYTSPSPRDQRGSRMPSSA